MSKEERLKYIRDFKKYLDKETATKEDSQKFMQKLGVYTKTGRLSKNYSNP